MRKLLQLCFWLAITSLVACSNASPSGGITVSSAWMRSSLSSANSSAAYLIIDNAGAQDDQLLSARCDCAAIAELHQTQDMNGMLGMSPVSAINVPAHGRVEFKPGGLHIMLMDLTRDLKAGDQVTLTLNFKTAGTIAVQAAVRDQ